MKHKVYMSRRLEEVTEDALFLAEVETRDEMWRAVDRFLDNVNFKKDKHCRFILEKDITGIDIGSWSMFVVISPAFSKEELFGNDA